MREVHLLGSSVDPVAIIFDLIKEESKDAQFIFYPNLDKDLKPGLPVKDDFKFKIMSVGTAPDTSEKVVRATPGPKNKTAIFNYFSEKHNINEERYMQIIHPSSYIADSSRLEKGVLIEPHVVISSQTLIGFSVFIKRGSLIGHHNKIGAFTDINPGVTISSNVSIGVGCEIGSGAVIRDNVSIGDNTVIGMGSVVVKDVPGGVVAFGNPCREVGGRRK